MKTKARYAYRFIAALTFACALVASGATAAEITPHKNWILIEGAIDSGDYAAFGRVVSEFPWLRQVNLASPGGDVAEALQIGLLVRRLNISTVVPAGFGAEADRIMATAWGVQDVDSNNVCASACFFVHVAGISRTGSRLGIHRPFMDSEALKAMLGTDAMAESRNVKYVVDRYLQDMGVPSKYSEIMFSTRKDDIYWISEDEISRDFLGPIPDISDWIESKCGKNPLHIFSSSKDTAERVRAIREYHGYSDCEWEALAKLHMEAWVLARLQRVEGAGSNH